MTRIIYVHHPDDEDRRSGERLVIGLVCRRDLNQECGMEHAPTLYGAYHFEKPVPFGALQERAALHYGRTGEYPRIDFLSFGTNRAAALQYAKLGEKPQEATVHKAHSSITPLKVNSFRPKIGEENVPTLELSSTPESGCIDISINGLQPVLTVKVSELRDAIKSTNIAEVGS
jgi:hypothetical protein